MKEKVITWLKSFQYKGKPLVEYLEREYPMIFTPEQIEIYFDKSFDTMLPEMSIKFVNEHKSYIECKYTDNSKNNPISLKHKFGRKKVTSLFELDCIMYEDTDDMHIHNDISIFNVQGNNVIGFESIF